MLLTINAPVVPVDVTPPVPTIAAFSTVPTADSDTAISMTAVIGGDSTPPVEYLFTETTGGPGASSSSWQTSPDYTDSGLTASTLYTYKVQMRDSVGTPNVGTESAELSATTDAP